MPTNEYTCPRCTFYYDTPNHQIGCERVPLQPPLHQIPKIDPEENWKEYSTYLENEDGTLDLQKVKEFAAHAEWAWQNNAAFLAEDLQYSFSKPHTHASWVAAAIRESFHEEKMYEVEEILEILESGGFEDCETAQDTIKSYYDYDAWVESKQRGTT